MIRVLSLVFISYLRIVQVTTLPTSTSPHSCFGVLSNLSSVCSGSGTCIASNICVCDELYHSADCSSKTKCYSISFDSQNVCSGHGTCVGENVCLCENSYSGDLCDVAPEVESTTTIVDSISKYLTIISTCAIIVGSVVLFVIGLFYAFMKLVNSYKSRREAQKIVPKDTELQPESYRVFEELIVEDSLENLEEQMTNCCKLVAELHESVQKNEDFATHKICFDLLAIIERYHLQLSTPALIMKKLLGVLELCVELMNSNERVNVMIVKCFHEFSLLVLYNQLKNKTFRKIQTDVKERSLSILRDFYASKEYSPLQNEIDCAIECVLRISDQVNQVNAFANDVVGLIGGLKAKNISDLVKTVKTIRSTSTHSWYNRLILLRFSFRFLVNTDKVKLSRFLVDHDETDWHLCFEFIGYCKEMLNEIFGKNCTVPNCWYRATPSLFESKENADAVQLNVWRILRSFLLKEFNENDEVVKFLQTYTMRRVFSILEEAKFVHIEELRTIFKDLKASSPKTFSDIVNMKNYPLVRDFYRKVVPVYYYLGLKFDVSEDRGESTKLIHKNNSINANEVIEIIVKEKNVLIRGQKNCGKTPLLRHLCFKMIANLVGVEFKPGCVLPIIVSSPKYIEMLEAASENPNYLVDVLLKAMMLSIEWRNYRYDEMKIHVLTKQMEKIISRSEIFVFFKDFEYLSETEQVRILNSTRIHQEIAGTRRYFRNPSGT